MQDDIKVDEAGMSIPNQTPLEQLNSSPAPEDPASEEAEPIVQEPSEEFYRPEEPRKRKHRKPLASSAVLFDSKLYSIESSSEDEENGKDQAKPILPTRNSEEYNKKIVSAIALAKKTVVRRHETSVHHQGSESIGVKDVHILGEYNVLLNLTDVSYGQHGHNKYYRLKVLESNDKKIYYTFSEWGRVGAAKPQSKLEKFVANKAAAIAEFEKKFHEKTMNLWEDRQNFKPVEGKYVLVSTEGAPTADPLAELLNKENELKKVMDESWGKPSTLPEPIKNLMGIIWDLKRMQRTMKELNFDPAKFPLGKLSKEQIQMGFTILGRIQDVLMSGKRNEDTLVKLSNEFYSMIPQNYGMKKPPTINHLLRLREKISLLEALSDIDLAHTYLMNALGELKEKSAADVFYGLLKCEIKPILLESPEGAVIIDCVRNTHGPKHRSYRLSVEEIFRVKKDLDDMRFFPFTSFPNKRLLWHGSRVTNMAGILMNSLKIAPPEAPSTGYMFGKGVYFTEVSSKAANYCKPTKEHPEILLLLCEVALGNIQKAYSAKSFKRPPVGYHSVNGVGKMCPDAEQRIVCDEALGKGAIIEMGRVMKNPELGNMETELEYNEFVVYDMAQIKMRYLVKCKTIFLTDSTDDDMGANY